MRVSGGEKCLFFGKFGVLCFLVTPVLRFALLPYYQRIIKGPRELSSKKYRTLNRDSPVTAPSSKIGIKITMFRDHLQISLLIFREFKIFRIFPLKSSENQEN